MPPDLKSTIARKFNVEDEQVTIGNGSNDIIEFVARIFLTAIMARMIALFILSTPSLYTLWW